MYDIVKFRKLFFEFYGEMIFKEIKSGQKFSREIYLFISETVKVCFIKTFISIFTKFIREENFVCSINSDQPYFKCFVM